tara:strand:+ start:64 stop:606 length:543 start_codon:yes stop_codon:yes gene_type:complete
MALTLRRNPIRNRIAPKRFEDEKFVSGSIDRYQHCYDANNTGKYDCINGDEDYYTTRDGRKFTTLEWRVVKGRIIHRFRPRDFTESVLEFTSIWRDLGMVLPGALVSHISSFLKLSNIDQALIADDDEFVVGDEEEEPQDVVETNWCGHREWDEDSDETDEDSDWDSDCLIDDDLISDED